MRTFNLSISAREITGAALPNGQVSFELTKTDVAGGIIVPLRQSVVLDANGMASIALWPNSDGNGGTQYRVTIRSAQGTPLYSGLVTMPPNDTNLHDIIDTGPPASFDVATVATIAAQSAATSAAAAAASAAAAGGAAGFTQAGTGAVPRTVQAKARESVSVLDFGAVGDGTTDDYAAIMAAINSLGVNGGTVLFTPGTYKINTTLELRTNVRLVGSTTGLAVHASLTPVKLTFAANTSGIIVQRYNTTGLSGTTGYGASGGDGSVIEGLELHGSGTGGNGITLRARAHVRNCSVFGFGGHGLAVIAGSDGNPTMGNANNWRIEQCRSYDNGGSGVYVAGTDANAGHCSNVDVGNNGTYGFYESSFLKNLYTACHAVGCPSGAYYATNYSLFVGCYAESGTGGNPINFGKSIHLVPMFDPGTALTGDTIILDASAADIAGGQMVFNRPVKVQAYNAASKSYSFGANGALSSYTDAVNFASGVYHGADITFDTNFVTKYGISSFVYWDMDTGPNTTLTFRRSAPVPFAKYIPKLFVGNGRTNAPGGSDGAAICSDSAAPTTGEWAKGDVVFNQNATAGGFAGWICTTAGTPGTWKTFGAISA